MADFFVKITRPRGNALLVDPDPIQIGLGDAVYWQGADFPFTIEFSSLPGLVYHVQPFEVSPAVVFDEPGTYKYSVTVEGVTLDPQVWVLPFVSDPRRPPTGPQRPPKLPRENDDPERR